jgi:tetratricopeptide (TPR) repeat protein
MYRALSILKVSAGENHPDIAALYLNLGLMYQDFEHFQAAIDCFLESLYRNLQIFGEKHLQVVSCYQAIGHAHYQLGDYRKALDYQEKAHKALIAMGSEVDEAYLKSSKAQMDHFMKLSVFAEKMKSEQKQARPIGSNKGSAA